MTKTMHNQTNIESEILYRLINQLYLQKFTYPVTDEKLEKFLDMVADPDLIINFDVIENELGKTRIKEILKAGAKDEL